MLAAVAVLLAVSGGVRATVGGLRISVRSPIGASVAALAVVVVWWVLARRAKSVERDLESAWSALELQGTLAVILLAATSGTVATLFATGSATGADASGYLSQAAMWERGGFLYTDELALTLTVTDPWITSPLGWRPTDVPWVQVPTYPPGLPWLMSWVPGTSHPDWVVMLSAAAAVCATGLVAVRLAGAVAGMLAAFLLAVSPAFLFQSVQPMSDVPVTAAWMTCWALLLWSRAPSDVAGIACAIAVLIRPNLAPLAAVPLFAIGVNLRRLAGFALPVVIAGALLMLLQNMWYGSPLRSGYGTADELFALSNIGANASRYGSWLMTTSPVLLVAPVGVALLWRDAFTKSLAAFSVLVVAAYLVYAVFDVWSYLRFLLPAMAVAAVFAGAAIAAGLNRVPMRLRLAGALVVILGVSAHGVSQARALDAFRLADQQRRVAQAADFISTMLPPDAVIVAGEQSGAMRYYTGRSILRWDAASPDSLSAALSTLTASGRPVVVALDAWEREPFRARFSGLPTVSLEWPAAFEAGTSHRTHVWRLRDRERFLRGERVDTERQP